jgi:predicted Zn-dependent protease
MRLPTFFTLTILAATCLALPMTTYAADQNWRERASAEQVVTEGDVGAEITFGREISARILGRYKPYDNPALVKYVSLVGLSLARSTNRPELEYHFMILDTNEVNAYAAPGGYVFVTKGALLLMKDESELAGVLAHEIAHVTEKHVVKELKIKGVDDTVTSGLAQLVGASSEAARTAFAQAVDKGLDIIFRNGYKREDEMQADRTAVTISALSGYSSAGLARYLDRISTIKESVPDTNQKLKNQKSQDQRPVDQNTEDTTHPSFTARIAQINAVIANDGIDTGGLATNKERFDATVKNLK